MRILGLIPARYGSKGIHKKNIRLFCGKPLLQWTIEVALSSPSVDQVVVSTDSLEVADIARSAGADVPFLRPPELASDSSSAVQVVLHALGCLPDITDVLLLQPTSPLRAVEDVEGIISKRRDSAVDSAVSVTSCAKHPAWTYYLDDKGRLEPVLGKNNLVRRQDLSEACTLNGALYLSSRVFVEREKSLMNDSTIGFWMPPERSVDIDTMMDFHWAEFLKGVNHE